MNAPRTLELSITGMRCGGCAGAVEGALRAVPGAQSVAVNLAERRATVTGSAAPEALVAAVKRAGYTAVPREGVERGA